MKKIAVDGGRECLARARDAYNNMRTAQSFDKMEAAWTDFLLMSNRVYVRLEQGAKGNNQSFGWYGRKKHERRKDQLLSYVKNARDADEHGLERITEREPGKVAIHFPEGAIVNRGVIGGGNVNLEMADDRPIDVVITPPGVILIEVTNYGDKYTPPNTDPLIVAEAFLKHLDGLLSEAEKLV